MRFLRRFATALVTAALLGSSIGVLPVSAHPSPAGCNSNNIDLDISVTPGVVQPGGTVTYTVSVANGGAGACDVTGATISVTLPNAVSGLPTGSVVVLATNASFPADGSGDTVYPGQTFTVPSNGTFTGTLVRAQAAITGSVVHIVEGDPDTADTTKTATAQVVDAEIDITPPVDTNEAGTPHTFTIVARGYHGAGLTTTFNSITPTVSPAPTSQSTTCNAPTIVGDQATCFLVINNSTQGTFTANASAAITVGGLQMNRDTDPNTATICGPGGQATGCGPAVKHYVDASIAITPAVDTNEVGDAHTFTVTVTALPNGVTPTTFGTITPSVSPAPDSSSNTCATPNIVGNVATCTITISNNSEGTFTANATASVTMGGAAFGGAVTVTRDTDPATLTFCGPGGQAVGCGPADKHFVDAGIVITPPLDTNPVGTPHTFTIVVTAFPDDVGNVVFDSITPSVSPAPSSQSTTCATPIISGGGEVATCFLVINSNVPGTFTANAVAQVTMGSAATGGPETVIRDTNPQTATICGPQLQATGCGPAVKIYVAAKITIDPDDVNEVGQPHVFTVTVSEDTGSGFVAAAGETVTVTLTNSLGAAANPAGPFTGTTNANGQFLVTFTSATAGLVTGHASSTVSVSGQSIVVETNGVAPNSDDAVKRFVDAFIRIDPQTATNPVDTLHTFTITVGKNAGDGLGFVPAAGENVTFTTTGVGSLSSTTCGAPLDANGQCRVVWTSPIAGTTTIFADVILVVQTVSLHRDSNSTTANVGHGPGGSDEANKLWIAPGECFVLWDEEALDNDFRTVENAARLLGVTPDALINDDRPRESNNVALLWNELRAQSNLPADHPAFQVRIPTGQDMDEGWFSLPPEISYSGKTFAGLTDSAGNVINDAAWFANLNSHSQSLLDKIKHVQPLRDRDLATMVGQTCTALVWDSDISMNYNGFRTGNLQGARLGFFTFKVVDVVQPQAYPPVIPESTSSTSFFDVIIQVLPPATPAPEGHPVNNVLQTDTVQITRARCSNGTLLVRAESSRSGVQLYIAVEGLISEESLTEMDLVAGSTRRFTYTQNNVNCSALRNKVVTVYSSGGGNPLAPDAFGSGGTYNARVSAG